MLTLLVCSSAAAQGIPPSNLAPPSVSDLSPVDGETLTASEGEWFGAPPPSIAFQWVRCEGDACAEIPDATSSTYVVTPRDVGVTLLVRVTASNSAGTASADSARTGVVAPARVRNVSVPVVTGTPREGQVVSTSRGQWTGTPPIELGVRWERCTALGTGCVAIPGATGDGYRLSPADVGMTLRAAVTASNAAGPLTVHSSLTAIVVAAARLVSVEPPEIVGVAQVGQVLRATSGRWAPTGPTDFLYRWFRCTADGSNCASIPGAIGDRYEVREQDLGSRLRVRVTAISDAGSASRDSALTAVVTALSAGERAQPRLPRLMRPFPRVRIRGYFTRSGAVLQTVTVRGPRGATAVLVCRGSDCPFRHRTRRLNRRLRVRSLERHLEAGTKIVVRVSKPGRIGKHTRILIRAGRPPARWDRCLRPGRRAPVRCPG